MLQYSTQFVDILDSWFWDFEQGFTQYMRKNSQQHERYFVFRVIWKENVFIQSIYDSWNNLHLKSFFNVSRKKTGVFWSADLWRKNILSKLALLSKNLSWYIYSFYIHYICKYVYWFVHVRSKTCIIRFFFLADIQATVILLACFLKCFSLRVPSSCWL